MSRESVSNDELITRMVQDSNFNDDGWSAMFVLGSGKPMFLQSLDLDPIVSLVLDLDWTRMFLHARAATQGSPRLDNCHGWSADGVYVFHNGILSNPQSRDFEVDSQLIHWWIDRYGVTKTLNLLRTERYANVMLVDTISNEYLIHRSETGSLFTDGNGNFSSNIMGDIRQPVRVYTNDVFELGLKPVVDKYSGYMTDEDEYNINWSSVVSLTKYNK